MQLATYPSLSLFSLLHNVSSTTTKPTQFPFQTMVKLASARDFRTYGPGLTRNRYEYINAGLYLFATVILCSGFAAQLSPEARSGLVLLLTALTIIFAANLHDILAHFAGIDFRLALMSFDLQLFFVEFTAPFFQIIGTFLLFLGLLLIFIQEENGYFSLKMEKQVVNLLVAGPVLWVVGSIHNSCQVYERADGHVQILQQFVYVPFLMGSLSFMLGAILNYHEQYKEVHHGIYLLGGTWIWLGMFGSSMFFIGGLTNLVKVFKMQQMNGIRLEKLRGGAHERLVNAREGRVPLILEQHQPITNINRQLPEETKLERLVNAREGRVPLILEQHQPIPNINRQLPEETKLDMHIPIPTPYKDVLIGLAKS